MRLTSICSRLCNSIALFCRPCSSKGRRDHSCDIDPRAPPAIKIDDSYAAAKAALSNSAKVYRRK